MRKRRYLLTRKCRGEQVVYLRRFLTCFNTTRWREFAAETLQVLTIEIRDNQLFIYVEESQPLRFEISGLPFDLSSYVDFAVFGDVTVTALPAST